MRLRITFSKTGSMIYIGNLDLHTLWERAARRAGLALAYSKGFHPQPKLRLAAPLPLGFSSRCELMDMQLNQDVDCDSLPERLNAVLPGGVRVLSAEEIEETEPALQAQVVASDYQVCLRGAIQVDELEQRLKALLAETSLPRERRSRAYDLRPLIQRLDLHSREADGAICLDMRLSAREGATGRPDEVLEALGIPREDARIERTALHFATPQVESPSRTR